MRVPALHTAPFSSPEGAPGKVSLQVEVSTCPYLTNRRSRSVSSTLCFPLFYLRPSSEQFYTFCFFCYSPLELSAATHRWLPTDQKAGFSFQALWFLSHPSLTEANGVPYQGAWVPASHFLLPTLPFWDTSVAFSFSRSSNF